MKRYERVAEHLIWEIEQAKPSRSPDKYPVLDPYLTGYEKALVDAQHIVRISTRRALTRAAQDKP